MSYYIKNADGSRTLIANVGSGGGGGGSVDQVQADWNTTNTDQPSYIKNKPFTTPETAPFVLKDGDTVTGSILTNLTNFTNNNEFVSKKYVDDLVSGVISLDIRVVTALPTTDISSTTIYLVPKAASANNIYDEYIYVNNSWELIGSTEVDLSDYYTKAEIDATLGDYLEKTGGEVTGTVTTTKTSFTNNQEFITKKYVDDNIPDVSSFITEDDLEPYAKTADIPAQVQADWNEADTTSKAYIQNKPDLSDVVREDDLGAYLPLAGGELTGHVTTTETEFTEDQQLVTKKYVDENGGGGATQVQSDWDEEDTTEPSYIQNKPDLTIYAESADLDDYVLKAGDTVSGAITSSKAAFTIGNEFVTKSYVDEHASADQVQTNWDETDSTSKAYIRNKPEIPSADDYVLKAGDTMTGALSIIYGNYNNLLNGTGLIIRELVDGSIKKTANLYTNSVRYQFTEADNTTTGFTAEGANLRITSHDNQIFSVTTTNLSYTGPMATIRFESDGSATTTKTAFTKDNEFITKAYADKFLPLTGGAVSNGTTGDSTINITHEGLTGNTSTGGTAPTITGFNINTVNDNYYITNEGDAHFESVTVENIYNENGDVITPVQSDWTETDASSLAYIAHKPDNLGTTGATGNVYTKEETLIQIQQSITGGYQIVDTLPTTGEANVVYLVAIDDTDLSLGYNQYIYSEDAWISIGATTGGGGVQSDWNVNTTTNPAYIKNKPNVITRANLTDGSITEIDIGDKSATDETSVVITNAGIVAKGTGEDGVTASGFENISTRYLDVSDIGNFGTGDVGLDIDAYGIRAYDPTATITGFQTVAAEYFEENGVNLANKYVVKENLTTDLEIEEDENTTGLFNIHFIFDKG